MNCTHSEFLVLSKDILANGNELSFQAPGGSMYPFIRGEETVHVRAVNIENIRYADIVLFNLTGDKIIVHRVIKIRRLDGKTQFLTKGDCLRDADGYIEAESVLGKVTVIEKGKMKLCLEKAPWKTFNAVYAFTLPFSGWILSLIMSAIKPFIPCKTGNH